MATYYCKPKMPVHDPVEARWQRFMGVLGWGIFFLLGLAGLGYGYYCYYWTVRLPQELTLTTRLGEHLHVRIDARSDKVLKLAQLDREEKLLYYPISELVDTDQAYVNRLPVQLTFNYPFEYVTTDAQGRESSVQVEGRDSRLLKISPTKGGDSILTLLKNYSATDQLFFSALPKEGNFSYPLTQTFTDRYGKAFKATVTGRDDMLVRLKLAGEAQSRLWPLTRLSPADQELLAAMPGLQLSQLPQSTVLTDLAGRAYAVTLVSRTLGLVKFEREDTGQKYVFPFSHWLADDQTVLRAMPPSEFVDYPFQTEILDPQGRVMEVTVKARGAETLSVVRTSDNKAAVLDLAKLSVDDQAFARQLPVIDDGTPVQPVDPLNTSEIKDQLAQLDVMTQEMNDLRFQASAVAMRPVDALAKQKEINDKQLEMNELMLEIIRTAAMSANTPAATAASTQAIDLQKKITDLSEQWTQVTTKPPPGARSTPPATPRGSGTTPVTPQQVLNDMGSAQTQLMQIYRRATQKAK